MTKSLKPILLQIAQLPSKDQRWILHKLSDSQRNILKKWDGLNFLKNALNTKASDLKIAQELLPDYCRELMTKPPLYAAIVLEQGAYSWAPLFLEQFDTKLLLRTLTDNKVPDIKPSVKRAIFNEWMASLSFESHLDAHHG